jgi:uncharacterized protein involved in exopolysaccharide biosynthesis
VLKVQAVFDKIDQQIDSRIKGILAGIDFKVRSLEQDQETQLKARDGQQRRQAEMAMKVQNFANVKRELEQQKQILQAIDLRWFQEKVDAQVVPSTPTVEVVDLAEPGLRPVRPNWPANLAVGLLLGLLASGVMIFLRPSGESQCALAVVRHQ